MTDSLWLKSQIDKAKHELEQLPRWQQQAIREEVKAVSKTADSTAEHLVTPKQDM